MIIVEAFQVSMLDVLNYPHHLTDQHLNNYAIKDSLDGHLIVISESRKEIDGYMRLVDNYNRENY